MHQAAARANPYKKEQLLPQLCSTLTRGWNSETDHLFQVRSVAWDHAAPEFDINATLALCSLNFDPWDPFSDETPHDTAAYLRFSGDVVGGRAFRGMSTIVVTPPKAAALVAVVNPNNV